MSDAIHAIPIGDTPDVSALLQNPKGMHPGIMNGFRVHPLKNTCKPHKGKGKLAKKQAWLSARRLAHSVTLKTLPPNVNPAAFKTPGSMNEHK